MIVESLRVFVAVTEQRHFSRAAELLNLSQPGVSQHIRNLENELGARLLHRSPKYVRLTEAGDILYQKAKKILNLYEEAKQDIHLLQNEVTGLLQIGASFTIGEYVLPKCIAEFAAKYPLVNMQATIGNTEEIVQAVRANELDIGLIEGQTSASDLVITPFMRDEMIIIAPSAHPLAALRIAAAEQLHDQIWVLRESGSGTRDFSDQFFAENKLVQKRSYIFNSSQSVKEAVLAGLGIAFLSRWVVRKELETGDLMELPIQNARFERQFSIIRHKEASLSLAVTMLLQKLLSGSD
ncbi:DNA-binding transcriptional LysR family regulator [Paenibacillus endophyticus]|uniref:DNA-binding transcriptional LysR family regulator n=1 Tax=Paenibacillus endophyticus TaxID=1294268 RepID=A0A7W5CES0_9BACL|nr:LysR family transcriptional regulator [Paenibacillus endophyticus]MBB3156277.1 DNA-binding transcriptional LysR family regulator [Paenibacillus endophyticus]